MRILLRALVVIVVGYALLAGGSALGGNDPATSFDNDEMAQEAARFEASLSGRLPAEGETGESLRRKANELLKNGQVRQAVEVYRSSAALDGGDAGNWIGLARALLAVQGADANERLNFPRDASVAAYLGWRRGSAPETKAEALIVLGESLAARLSWRSAIDAYRSSLALKDDSLIRAEYEKLRADHGFRALDHFVDSETAAPRLCVQFSEALEKGAVDFAKFVSVNNDEAAVVRAEGRNLCVEELVHGRRYEVRIKNGLPSAVNEPLDKPVELAVHVRDRSPAVRFAGRAYVLPSTGQQGVPLVSVNVSSVSAEIYRIGDRRVASEVIEGQFGEQATSAKILQLKERQGEKLWAGELSVVQVLNEEVMTAFPIDELRSGLKPGLYVMIVQPGDDAARAKGGKPDAKAVQWFVISDVGLSAFSGADGVHVFARALARAGALAGVEVRLIARNNEVLAEAKTGEDGHAHLETGLAAGVGGPAPAFVTARDENGDYGFLDLAKSAFDLSDRGVGGRVVPGPLDAMVIAERGVYRPGDDVRVTALLRDASGKAAAGLPLTLKVFRPDGVEFRRELTDDAGAGGRSFSFALDPVLLRGSWRVSAYADTNGPAIGETTFLVEDYAPERLELSVEPNAKFVEPGRPVSFSLAGRYLFGAPASGLAVEGEVCVSPRKSSFPGLDGFHFGLEEEDAPPRRRPLTFGLKTGADGRAEAQAETPPFFSGSRPLVANMALRLLEPGGRPVERSVELPVKSAKPFIGVKPLFQNGHSAEDQLASFQVAAVDGEGNRIELSGLKWRLVSVHNRFQWYFRDGRWSYEPITYTNRVAEGVVDAGADKPAVVTAPVRSGGYRFEISSASPQEAATSVTFQAGWYVSEASDAPEILDLALDKPAYKAGDEIKARILPRMAGEAIVAVVSDRVLAIQTVSAPAEGVSVTFRAKEDWGPGAYVIAMLFRPMDAAAKRTPSRAVGVKWLPMDASARTLQVEIGAPEKIRSGQQLRLSLDVRGLAEGERAYVRLAAVDAGVLGLTNYQTPDPVAHYFGRRRLGLELRDLYGKLIDGVQGVRGVVRSGGDGVRLGRAPAGLAPVSKAVSLHSGILRTGEDGKAEATIEAPQFEGTLRLAAIVWNDGQLGRGVRDVIVRDPVAVTASPPRFLTIGDAAEMHVSLENMETVEGEYSLAALSEGGVGLGEGAADRKLLLKPGERQELTTPLKADRLGPCAVRLVLTRADGLSIERRYALIVEPATRRVIRRSVENLAALGGALSVGSDAFSGLIPQSVRLAVSPGAAEHARAPGFLLTLDRRSYESAEFVASRALPRLYYASLFAADAQQDDAEAKLVISEAIARLPGYQASNGAFGLWSASGHDLWLTAYITDFLLRAQELSHPVSRQTLEAALARLKQVVDGAGSEFEEGSAELAYALYVLARAGRPSPGDLRYYADDRLSSFGSALAQAQIGAALALVGDKERAERVFVAVAGRMNMSASGASQQGRSDFGSDLRDRAAALALMWEARASPLTLGLARTALQKLLSEQSPVNHHESAWLLLAVRALAGEAPDLPFEVNGKAAGPLPPEVFGAENLLAQPFELKNVSDESQTAALTVSGVSASPEPAAASGFAIERRFYDMDGQEVSVEKVKQNARFVVALRVTEAETRAGRIILEDRLPAGFEIENPALLKAGDLRMFSNQADGVSPEFTAFRDNGVMAAFSLTDSNRTKAASLTLAYVVRAVTVGDYIYPGARVEDMLHTERFAETSSGKVRIGRAE